MAEGGRFFGEGDDLIDLGGDDEQQDDDDEQEVERTNLNTTGRFQPGAASTPHPAWEQYEMQPLIPEEKDGRLPPVPSFDDLIPEKEGIAERAIDFIKRRFPRVDLKRLGPKRAPAILLHSAQKGVKQKFSKLTIAAFSKPSKTDFQHPLAPVLKK